MYRRCMEFPEFTEWCYIVAPRTNAAVAKKDKVKFCTALWEVSQRRAFSLNSPGVQENPYKDVDESDAARERYHAHYKQNEAKWARDSIWHSRPLNNKDGKRYLNDDERGA